MTKKVVKEEMKKPDFFITTMEKAYDTVRANLKLCLSGAALLILIIIAVYGFLYYRANENAKIQYTLALGIEYYDDYFSSAKKESLDRAEEAFQKVKKNNGNANTIASLYLAKIATLKGKSEEAKSIYKEVAASEKNPLLKSLAEKALTDTH